MKSIKNRLCKIVVATAMILSGCFVTQTVEAVDNTGNTSNSNYFTNNLVVESDKVIGNNSFKGDKPYFKASTNDEGSELTQGATEGQVWTNKTVEKAAEDGLYKITFQTVGFKYRYVNEDNEKEDNIWKNPLQAGSTLSITEAIDSNFHIVNDNDLYKMEITNHDGLDSSKIIFYNNNGTIELKFDANDISGFDHSYNNQFNYSSEDGVAFDVEATFYVRVNSEVDAGTYETKDANSEFIPAEDNFYYYEWGSSKEETTYGYDGINWNNSEDGMKGIVNIKNIEIPTGVASKTLVFSIGNQGTNNIKQPENKQYGPGNYVPTTPEKTDDRYYYFNVKEYLNVDWQDLKIKNLYFYWYARAGAGEEKEALMRIEVQYDDDSWTVFTPVNPLNNNGGNEPAGTFWAETIITKDEPSIRKDKDPDGNGVINETFTNHGQIILRTITENDLKQAKTASLIDWDDRTYQIDLYAAHDIKPQDKIANIVMMLDFSGSMPWFVEQPGESVDLSKISTSDKNTETIYKNSNGTLLEQWNYKYYTKVISSEGGQKYEYKPIVYLNSGEYDTGKSDGKLEALKGGWYIVKSASDGRKVIDVDKDDRTSTVNKNEIYSRSYDKQTKLEALYTSISYFIENLKVVSPQSQVAIVTFAGNVKPETISVSQVANININSYFDGTYSLRGDTNQGLAMNNMAEFLQNDQTLLKDNTYALLFTDGAYTQEEENDGQYHKEAADDLKNEVNTFFTAGIFADKNCDGAQNLVDWASDDSCVYIEDTANDLINAFADIFARITVQISNATIIDYIDYRFIIIDDNGNKLEKGDQFAGGTIGYDQDKKQYYIQWNDVNLSYSQDVHKGWHQTIYVKAKEEYIGGNNVTTNGVGSGINVGSIHKEFNKPEVNVKVDFVVGNADETIFLGEAPLEGAKDKLFGSIKNSKGTTLTIAPDGSELSKDNFEYSWYSQVEGDMSDIVDGSKVENPNDTRPQEHSIYYLQVKLDGVNQSSLDAESNTDGKDNIELKCIFATNDMDGNHKVGEGLGDYQISDYAKSSSKYGVYIIDVVSGSIIINKTIDEMTDNDTQGDPIFTFHITGETVSGDEVNEYRSVRFEKNDGTNKFVATIDGLEKGEYTITELDTLRYEFKDVSINAVNSQADCTKDGKVIKCFIGYNSNNDTTTNINRRNVSITYSNHLSNEIDQSDTDIVTNSFKVNKNGQIEISANHYTITSED